MHVAATIASGSLIFFDLRMEMVLLAISSVKPIIMEHSMSSIIVAFTSEKPNNSILLIIERYGPSSIMVATTDFA
jgi:hypothetical protein